MPHSLLGLINKSQQENFALLIPDSVVASLQQGIWPTGAAGATGPKGDTGAAGPSTLTDPTGTAAFYGGMLSAVTIPKIFASNLQVTTTNLYTVPAGRSALILSGIVFNSGGASVSYSLQIKVGATYYRICTPDVRGTQVASTCQPCTAMMVAGEVLAAVVTANVGLNLSMTVIEFDELSPVKRGILTGIITGDNTLYTCPVGKTATILGLNGQATVPFNYVGNTGLIVSAGGTSLTIRTNIVPSGGTPSAANQVSQPNIVSLNIRTQTGPTLMGSLAAGDFINVNSNATDAAAFLQVLMLEHTV